MRLINVKTFKLEEFLDQPPAYAILSHTWGDDSEELTLRDVQEGNIDKPGVGAVKFKGCCQQAEKDDLGYAWIDTCCIDKSDLAELSEAITSMFRWYSDASVCYAYLADVPADDNAPKEGSKFYSSRWFRRGWTLQELLAPQNVRFYNVDWKSIGTKGSMCAAIGKITGVPRQFLLGITDLHTASVAQRMSWAAQRETKKKEDLAYCLIGLFNVTMPLIYGEGGEQAFFRLQEQIVKLSPDDSVLAWGFSGIEASASNRPDQVVPGRILAASPSEFANSGHVVLRDQSSSTLNNVEFVGGSLRLNLMLHTTSQGNTVGLLNCRPENDDEHVVGIPLVQIDDLPDEFYRPKGELAALQLVILRSNCVQRPVYIKHEREKKQTRKSLEIKKQRYWLYEDDQLSEVHLSLIDVQPKSSWDKERALITSTQQPDNDHFHRSLARFRHSSEDETSPDFILLLEFEEQDSEIKAECYVMICSRDTASEDIFEKFEYLRHRVSGIRSVSNGILNLAVELEPVPKQPIFIIKPKEIEIPTEATVNVSAELEKFDLVLKFSNILEEKAQNDIREKWLEQAAREKNEPLEKKKKEREDIEQEIKKLEQRRKVLLAEELGLRAELYQVSDEQEEIREKRQDLSDQWLQAKERWGGLYGGIGSHTNGASQDSYDLESMAGRTPLLWAAENGDVETVRLLLYQGADVTVVDKDGQTALSAASSNGHLEIVRLLLATGKIDVNAKDDAGQTALGWAAEIGAIGLVRLLLKTGKVDINAKDNQGRTALKWAAEKKHEDVVSLLLEHGATGLPQTQIAQAQSPPREGAKPAAAADYSKAIDSRILDMLARTSSMGVIRGKTPRTSSDDKKPRSRTWFNLDSKKSQPVNVVITETIEEVPCTERRRTT